MQRLPAGRGRRIATVVLAAVLSAPALSACSAGFDATSLEPYAPADGVYAENEKVRVLNVLVVAAEGASTGVVSATLVNRGDSPDRLVSVDTDGGSASVTGSTTLAPGSTLAVGNPDSPSSVTVDGLSREPGQTIELTMTFEAAEPITVRTVVVPATGPYAEITPSATETPSP